MHGSGAAIIRFGNINSNGLDDNAVKLKLVRGSSTIDLATAKADATTVDAVFQYKDGDEVVLTETSTGMIFLHSLECADYGEGASEWARKRVSD